MHDYKVASVSERNRYIQIESEFVLVYKMSDCFVKFTFS